MIKATIQRLLGASAACAALAVGSPAIAQVQSPACPADFDCSGSVGVTDLLHLLGEWGNAGSNADLTEDGTVGVPDLLQLLAAWGPCTFDYPPLPDNTEAWQVALEMLGPNGPLVPSDELFERVMRDMELIRDFEPNLVGKTHVPKWAPNQIIASYEPFGQNPNVNCLLTAYQGEVVNVFFGHMHVIKFPGQTNMEAMAQQFADATETAWAEPDYLLGGDKFWVPTDLGNGVWHWWVDDGWHDCFDGCDCHIFYEFEVDADGNVTLISKTLWGMPWCVWPE